jgi:spermidine synthase
LLGTFMGGMCLGSLLLPRIMPVGWHPLRVYAGLELGIGATALALLFGMPLVGGVYTAWAGGGVSGILLRGVAASVCLLPPTLLMGATLPAIARWIETTPQGVAWLGFFYGGNIPEGLWSAVCLRAFYLLRLHDMAVATYVGAALNVGIALIALVAATRAPYQPAAPAPHASGAQCAIVGSCTWCSPCPG